jgi:ectoine hydroxylase-related dioxygenase (phytanoyl-CoA dioxygenase family)
MNTHPRHARLTPEQVAAYHRDGYLLPGMSILPDPDFQQLCQLFERLLAQWTSQGGRPEAMDTPHFYFPELMQFLLHPAVLDLVEPVLGPDIALFSSHFICKPAGDGRRVPWHEDSAYWRHQLDPMEVVTVWLALDESHLANGCLQVIPGSHHGGYSTYRPVSDGPAVFASEIVPEQCAAASAVPCLLKPNQASLHHARTIHGSAANLSAQRRCGYTMRYVSTRSRFDQAGSHLGLHQIYLARGQDRAGNRYADPAQPHQAWIERFGVFCPKGH